MLKHGFSQQSDQRFPPFVHMLLHGYCRASRRAEEHAKSRHHFKIKVW